MTTTTGELLSVEVLEPYELLNDGLKQLWNDKTTDSLKIDNNSQADADAHNSDSCLGTTLLSDLSEVKVKDVEVKIDQGAGGDDMNKHETDGENAHDPDAPPDPASTDGTSSPSRRRWVRDRGSAKYARYVPASFGDAASPLKYPLLYVAPTGSISIMLRDEVIVEIAVDKSIRVLCPGKFAAASNARGTASCIMHPQARIYQEDTRVYCQLGDEKLAVFGSQGVLFTMKRLNQAYLVSSSTIRGTTAIPLSCLQFPTLDNDFSLSLFYLQSQIGEQVVPLCEEIVRNAHYEQRDDGSLTINICGIFIKQDTRSIVEVISRPRFIRLSPANNTLTVRTHFVDMGVQEDEKSFVKRGVKRMHVSRSGMVVSDGNCITSMDHYGRIVSST